MLYYLFGDINIVIIIELSNYLDFFITSFEYLRNLKELIFKFNVTEWWNRLYTYKEELENRLILHWYPPPVNELNTNGTYQYYPGLYHVKDEGISIPTESPRDFWDRQTRYVLEFHPITDSGLISITTYIT